MDEREQLFIAQALYNAIAKQVSTKEPGNLRDRVSSEYKALYEETGAKSFDAKINGEKVGTFSITVSKPTESQTKTDFVIADEEKFKAWEDFNAAAHDYALAHLQEIANWHFGNTGEMPDGCEMQEYVLAGSPGGEVTKTALKVDAQKVAEVLGNTLPEAVYGILGAGSDD